MTELVYLNDSYLRNLEAKVVESAPDYVILDKTIFYPQGGGQPSDTGFMEFNGQKIAVKEVRKKDGKVLHFVEQQIPAGSKVTLQVDWEKRYKHMRMHSAQHLLAAVVEDGCNAETVGNQIGFDESRLDLAPFKPDDQTIKEIFEKANELVQRAIPIYVKTVTREEILQTVDPRRRNLFSRVPESVKEIRLVEIEGIDKCPCAGTHLQNTKEIGVFVFNKKKNTGADTTRIYFSLKPLA